MDFAFPFYYFNIPWLVGCWFVVFIDLTDLISSLIDSNVKFYYLSDNYKGDWLLSTLLFEE